MSESAAERLLLVTAAILMVKPKWWLLALALYGFFEVSFVAGSFFSRRGIVIGAQVVITAILLLFFHDTEALYVIEEAEEEVSYLSAVGILAAASFALFLMLYFLSRFWEVPAVLVLALDVCMVVRHFYFGTDNKFVVGIAIILTLAEVRRLISKLEEGRDKSRSLDRYLDHRWLTLFTIIGAVVLAIPSIEKPIDWSFVYEIGYRIRDGFEDLAESTGYYVSGIGGGESYRSGYSRLAGVSGAVANSTREELYVTTQGTRDNLYLTGNIEGDALSNAEDIQGRKLLDFLYLLYSHQVSSEEARCYARTEKATLEMGLLRTKDIIRPESVLEIDYEKGDEVAEDGATFLKTHRKGDNYTTIYMNIDYGSPYLENILREPVKVPYPTYEEMEKYCSGTLLYRLGTTISKEEYNKWAKGSRDNAQFLDASEFSTPRMEELAQRITSKTENDYDACRAVERYLRQYRYGRSSLGEIKENFVDQFLFETGEGYCVHFATSMVTLLRLNGIPARIVSGYCYAFPARNVDRFVVTGDMAHAWVEAYIDGAGWIPFEPTPGRVTSVESSWNYTIAEAVIPVGNSGVEGYDEDLFEVPTIPDEALEDLEEQEEEPAKERAKNLWIVVRTTAIIILGLIAYTILALLIMQLVKRVRYRNSSLSEKYNKNIKDILWLLDRQLPKNSSKPRLLEDYSKYFPEAENLFSVYYRQRFSGKSAVEAEVTEAEEYRKVLISREVKRHLRKLNIKIREDSEIVYY
jgi:transglutaminase-like putative cysteine protease